MYGPTIFHLSHLFDVFCRKQVPTKAAATLEPETTRHDRQDILQIKKQISKTLLFMSAATLKPI